MIDRIAHGVVRAIVGFVVGMTIYLGLTVLWWQFFPYQTADIVEPILVINEDKIIGEDEMLMLSFEVTKHTTLTPKVSRNIVCLDDSVHFVLTGPPSGVALPIGTFTVKPVYEIVETVPRGVECFFRFINEYQVNPIKRVTKQWLSEPFQVKE